MDPIKIWVLWSTLIISSVISASSSKTLMFVIDGTSPNMTTIADSIDHLIEVTTKANLQTTFNYSMIGVCENNNSTISPTFYNQTDRKLLRDGILLLNSGKCEIGTPFLEITLKSLLSHGNGYHGFIFTYSPTKPNQKVQADIMEASLLKRIPLTVFQSGISNPENDLIFSNIAADTNGFWFRTFTDKLSPIIENIPLIIDQNYQTIINNHSRLINKTNEVLIDPSIEQLILVFVGLNGAITIRNKDKLNILPYETIVKDENLLAVRLNFDSERCNRTFSVIVSTIADTVDNNLRGLIKSKIRLEYTLETEILKSGGFEHKTSVLKDVSNRYLVIQTRNDSVNLSTVNVMTTDRDRHILITLKQLVSNVTSNKKLFATTKKVFIFSTLFQFVVKGIDQMGNQISRLIIPGNTVWDEDFVARSKYNVPEIIPINNFTSIRSVNVSYKTMVLEGYRLELNCFYDVVNQSDNDPVHVYWTFGDNFKLADGNTTGTRLIIDKISRKYAGDFYCHAYTRYRHAISKPRTLTVLYPPKIENLVLNDEKQLQFDTNIVQDVYGTVDDPGKAILMCNVSGFPTPDVKIIWNGTEINDQVVEIETSVVQENQTIACVTESDIFANHNVVKTMQINVWPSIAGGWSDWVVIKPCPKSCSGSSVIVQKLKRACDSPPPKYGGANCVGHSLKIQKCKCEWSEFDVYQVCPICASLTPNKFTKVSNRTCLLHQNDAKECNGDSKIVTECNVKACQNGEQVICPENYMFNGTACTDIDECLLGSKCPRRTHNCHNTGGSVKCIRKTNGWEQRRKKLCNRMKCENQCILRAEGPICICRQGYVLNEDRRTCSGFDLR